ncbi:hypothetical protein VHEMI02235 [[Torrubiella] hemipterigena]|uniref:ubiquitinyl hydrolase 1 n=1 Tax=[Torrubiella] hemipterigena TaxID=1531966 RepID=A0A0A1SVB4_9HYPO|nr:hypothetical protein VHEMI02235 [[Torrubiella] hemipterigena]
MDPFLIDNKDILDAIINHVILPPKLPSSPEGICYSPTLLNLLIHSLSALSKSCGTVEEKLCDSLIASLNVFKQCHNEKDILIKDNIALELSKIIETGGYMPLYIHEQNAGMVIYKNEDKICFEFYELSPLNAPVCTTAGRLKRRFPSATASVDATVISDPKFMSTIVDALASMSVDAVPLMMPTIRERNKLVPNQKDTANPGIINMLLAGWLIGHGETIPVYPIDKHTRNEVSYGDSSSSLLWRRSPLWLHFRVSMQIQLHRQSSPEQASAFYKQFMSYFHAQILQCALDMRFGSDILALVKAKLAYRLQKLATPDTPHWMQRVEAVMKNTNETIEARWSAIQDRTASKTIDQIADIQPSDAHFSLSTVEIFVQQQTSPSRNSPSTIPFETIQLIGSSPENLPKLPPPLYALKDLVICQLGAFERWVEYNLSSWATVHMKRRTMVPEILEAAQQYHHQASRSYVGDPEGLSIMYLVIMELYCACDQSAVALMPLLADYAIPIPSQVFSSLLLRSENHLQRLKKEQDYLSSRKGLEKYADHSILTSMEECSFPCRYVDQNTDEQEVLKKLEQACQNELQGKKNELKKKQQALAEREPDSEDECCLYDVDASGVSTHNPACPNCIRSKALEGDNLIQISPVLQLLPPSEHLKKLIVFELRIPGTFKAWRDASGFVLSRVLCFACTNPSSGGKVLLNAYSRLDDFRSRLPSGEFVVLGYKGRTSTTPIPVTQALTVEEVCLPHGLNWSYILKENYASICINKKVFAEPSPFFDSCVFQLPTKSASLQQYLHRPHYKPAGVEPNAALARHYEHPDHLSQTESKGLCDLAYGQRQQWHSILTQLAQPTVDWRKTESLLFLLQVTLHAGQYDEEEEAWKTRVDLSKRDFGLESSRMTWVCIHIALCLRDCATQNVRQITDKVLTACREQLMHNLKTIYKQEAYACSLDLQHRALEIALMVLQTYEVDEESLVSQFSDSNVLQYYLLCAILVSYSRNDDHHVKFDEFQKSLYQQQRRRVFRVLRCIAIAVHSCPEELDRAIRFHIDSFKGGQPWSWNGDHWLFTDAEHSTGEPCRVHINILTSEIFINDNVCCQMPQRFLRANRYRHLFGRQRPDVSSLKDSSFDYCLQKTFQGYKVNVGLEKPSTSLKNKTCGTTNIKALELYVHATTENEEYILLPEWLFHERLPTCFLQKYIAWYCRITDTIIFRPKHHPWRNGDGCLTSRRINGIPHTWCLERSDGHRLVCSTSPGAASLATAFQGFVDINTMAIWMTKDSSKCIISVDSMKLDFERKNGSPTIYSKQFRGMYLDYNQNIGTLYGLQTKLVLTSDALFQNKKLLIPDGAIEFTLMSDVAELPHVQVNIAIAEANTYHAYDIDPHLGQLKAGNALQGRLFLAYIHAITSYEAPDPLTSKTGVDSALEILRSSEVASFASLGLKTSENILVEILKLSPTMRVKGGSTGLFTSWISQLPLITQRQDFYTEACNILQLAFTQNLEVTNWRNCDKFQPLILEKSALNHHKRRCAAFYNDGSYSRLSHAANDANYPSDEEDPFIAPLTKGKGKGETDINENYGASDPMSRGHCLDMLSMITHCTKAAQEKRPMKCKVSSAFQSRVIELINHKSGISANNNSLDINSLSYNAAWLKDLQQKLGQNWCTLHSRLKNTTSSINTPAMILFISSIAFLTGENDTIVSILLGFLSRSHVAQVARPRGDRFFVNTKRDIKDSFIVKELSKRTFTDAQKLGYTKDSKTFNIEARAMIQALKNRFLIHWNKRDWKDLTFNPQDVYYVDILKTKKQVIRLFQQYGTSAVFRNYIQQLHEQLKTIPKGTWYQITNSALPMYTGLAETPKRQSLADPWQLHAFRDIKEVMLPPPDLATSLEGCVQHLLSDDLVPIESLVEDVKSAAGSEYEKEYAHKLAVSFEHLEDNNHTSSLVVNRLTLNRKLDDCYHEALSIEQTIFGQLSSCIVSNMPTGSQGVSFRQHFLPKPSIRLLLRHLNRSNRPMVSSSFYEALIQLAVCVASVQQCVRLLQAANEIICNDYDAKVDKQKLIRELSNLEPRQWENIDYGDGLLFEIENNIRIRPTQAAVSDHMLTPQHNGNFSFQLNMGEGKTSVLLPIIAASISSCSASASSTTSSTASSSSSSVKGNQRIARIITIKSQINQVFDKLAVSLGGLLQRRIFQIPFSRRPELNFRVCSGLRHTIQSAQQMGGVFIFQYDHLLSLNHMATVSLLKERTEPAGIELRRLIAQFDDCSVDIIDECDDVLSVKSELVYTYGMQRPVDFAPYRWCIQQTMLDLIVEAAKVALEILPSAISITYDKGPRSFPKIEVHNSQGIEIIRQSIATHIVDRGIGDFTLEALWVGLSGEPLFIAKRNVVDYIMYSNPAKESVAFAETSKYHDTRIQKTLFLLRGLLQGGIIDMALRLKRFRVHYGFDHRRSHAVLLAVPFAAKDLPKATSEFSHPDTVIFLTCLSYYYEGLSDEQLFHVLVDVQDSDHGPSIYRDWVEDLPNLSAPFKSLERVNLQYRRLCIEKLFPHLRFNKGTIDYYLSKIVFPKAMRECPEKLTASGWDICKAKKYPVMGFSGTNDSNKLFPHSIKPFKLEPLLHTNALTLKLQLSPGNKVERLFIVGSTSRPNCRQILDILANNQDKINVIIDAGAQIIDWDNTTVIREWLQYEKDNKNVTAGVYFDATGELVVMDKNQFCQPLKLSPYQYRLEECVVFLDEANSRGTDLTLPRHYRAAVLLGDGITKDRMVQASMRMRKLGEGQTVTFFIPQEVEHKVRQLISIDACRSIIVNDILLWAIHQTWQEVRRSSPIWASQGLGFTRQRGIIASQENDQDDKARSSSRITTMIAAAVHSAAQRHIASHAFAQKLLEPEYQTLEQRFCWKHNDEQERELCPEMLQEMEIQTNPQIDPADHYIRDSLRHVIKTGEIKDNGFISAFESLLAKNRHTTKLLAPLRTELRVTNDFALVIKGVDPNTRTSFHRHVRWVLVVNQPTGQTGMIVISPFEAETLWAEIKQSKHVTLHSYSPRQLLNYPPIDGLWRRSTADRRRTSGEAKPKPIPIDLLSDLNIFAGQLYFRSYDEYWHVAQRLGIPIPNKAPTSQDSLFIPDAGPTFQMAKVESFVRDIISITRREARGADLTHMGKLLRGMALTPEDFVTFKILDDVAFPKADPPEMPTCLNTESSKILKYEDRGNASPCSSKNKQIDHQNVVNTLEPCLPSILGTKRSVEEVDPNPDTQPKTKRTRNDWGPFLCDSDSEDEAIGTMKKG